VGHIFPVARKRCLPEGVTGGRRARVQPLFELGCGIVFRRRERRRVLGSFNDGMRGMDGKQVGSPKSGAACYVRKWVTENCVIKKIKGTEKSGRL